MRKILFVVNEAYFFVTHRLAVAKAAQQAGFEVHVACPIDHVWAPSSFSIQELTKFGFTYHPIPLSRRGMNPAQEIKTIIALVRLYGRLRPDLIHHLTIKPIMYGGLAARLVNLSSVVSTVTGMGQVFVGKGIFAAMLRFVVKVLYRMALSHPNTAVIVQNRSDRHAFVNLRLVSRERVHLVRGSGVSLEQFHPKPESNDEPLVILPARLIWEKGIAEFVQAARQLRQLGLSARFALVGDTQESNPRAVPKSQLELWHREGVIEWWGRQTDMPRVYAESHVVCLPSSYGEGVPKVLLEAAASARSIVCTDIPGCTEVVRQNINGLVFPVGDVEALSNALRRLIVDGNLRKTFGLSGRQIAEAEFGEDQIADQTLSVYRSVLDEFPNASSR